MNIQGTLQAFLLNQRKRIYRGHSDRVLGLLIAIAALCVGVLNFLGWLDLDLRNVLSLLLSVTALFYLAFVVQSGRNGFLIFELGESLKMLVASRAYRIVEGHHAIHRVERDLLLASVDECRSCESIASSHSATDEFLAVWEALCEKVLTNREFSYRAVLAFDKQEHLEQMLPLLAKLDDCSNVELRLRLSPKDSPPINVLIADQGILLSFPIASKERGLAIHSEDPVVSQKLRRWFDNHYWRELAKDTVSLNEHLSRL